MRLLIACTVFFLFLGCAAPAPEFERQTFVPRKDIVANSLYQEGLGQYKSGRFMDSEMKFRQALFLFPDAQNIRSSLALVLKGNGLLDDAAEIYLDLVNKFPEVNEYKFNLADTYFRQKKYKLAEKYYEQAMLGFEKDIDPVKAALLSRTISATDFLLGLEPEAFCSSLSAYGYQPTQEQIVRHIKLLLAIGHYKNAKDNIAPFVAAVADVKDPVILKLAAITEFANQNFDEAKKLLQLASDHQTALQVVEPELETLRLIFKHKFPEPVNENEDTVEEEPKEFIFNEQNALYWPQNLIAAYREYQAFLESENS